MIPVEGLMAAVAALSALALACLGRMAKGPTAPDRVVALDAMGTIAVAALVVLGAAFGETIYVDVAVIYAILSFVSTLYVARYLEGER